MMVLSQNDEVQWLWNAAVPPDQLRPLRYQAHSGWCGLLGLLLFVLWCVVLDSEELLS
jgi:hypothetical protein